MGGILWISKQLTLVATATLSLHGSGAHWDAEPVNVSVIHKSPMECRDQATLL